MERFINELLQLHEATNEQLFTLVGDLHMKGAITPIERDYHWHLIAERRIAFSNLMKKLEEATRERN